MKMRQEKQSSMAAVALLVFIIALLKDGASGITVDVSPRNQIVKAGQKFTFMCHVAKPLMYCSIKLPGFSRGLNMNENTTKRSDYWYEGKGIRYGQCGITIAQIDDKQNGQFRCSLGFSDEQTESDGVANVTVARPPALDPFLVVTPEAESRFQAYSEDTLIKAMCTVKDARPAATISWFIGDDQITDGIGRSEITDSPNDLFTVQQNLSRKLTWRDSGKDLKCVATHVALDDRPKQTIKQIRVRFAPRPMYGPIEQFGFTFGQEGIITVQIHANPQPNLTWTVDNENISEGKLGSTQRFEAYKIQDMGNSMWTAKLRIIEVTAEDIGKKFVLTARNDVGWQQYILTISTSTEPQEGPVELGTGPIIGIVVAILVLLIIIFMLIFARATGRWCFSAGGAGRSGTSHSSSEAHIDPENQQPVHTEKTKSGHHTEGEGGMENPSVNHNVSTEYINGNNPQDTKKSDKDTPV